MPDGLLAAMYRDARYGVRTLLRTPVTTAYAIIVLALGVGANCAIFSIVDGLLLHPVVYPEPETLAMVWSHDSQGSLSNASAADYVDWRARSKTLSDFAAWVPTSFVLTGRDHPRSVSGARVSASFFRTLRVTPKLGRAFLPDEDGLDRPAAAARSAVISDRFWRDDLGSDPQVLGRTIYVDSLPYAIVGVAPPDFKFWWQQEDIWIPISLNPHDRDYRELVAIARLNAPRAQAAAEMAVIARSLDSTYPESDKGWTVQVEDFRDFLLNRTFRMRLLLLSGAVALILLIACANVASLLLARATARAKEIAVRIALGATGARLVRQLLTESALLALAGGGLGLAIAVGLIRLAPTVVPADAIPGGRIDLNSSVIVFALAITVLTCLLFGLAPAVAVARSDVQASLRNASRGSTAGKKHQRLRYAMIAAEAAVAVMLLAGAGLMIESVRGLSQASPGFDPKNVVTIRLLLPAAKYDAERSLISYRQGVERIAALPGVKSVAVASGLPTLNNMEVRFKEEGAPVRGEAELPSAPYAAVGPDYFRTLGIPLRRGRFFTEADNESAPQVAIVSEVLAARYFPNQDAIGKRLALNRPIRWQNGEEPVTLQIVGVVGDVRLDDPSADLKPAIYAPYAQNPWSRGVWFATRTERDPAILSSALRAEFTAIDKEQPMDELGSLEQRVRNRFVGREFQTGLMSSFALVAVILAALGIYGMNAYAVAQRTHEIGLRMALGASRGVVVRQILAGGMRPTAIGIAIGLAGAVAISIGLKSALAGSRSPDPVAFLGAALLLAIVAAVACLLPARKASRIDPAITLRTE